MKAGPIMGGTLLLLAAVGVAFWGVSARTRALGVVTQETREMAVPTVVAATPRIAHAHRDRTPGASSEHRRVVCRR